MTYSCYRCGNPVSLSSQGKAGRGDSCAHCSASLHACKNCSFYDAKAYNECHETSAERVVDKESANFCDFFKYREGASGIKSSQPSKAATLKKLDDLFK